MSTDTLKFQSWGFELFVPPTPFSSPPNPARFVMLDDLNDKFYDVDYDTSELGNTVKWQELALHKVQDPAIVFPPEQQDMLQRMSFAAFLPGADMIPRPNFAIGLLVSIQSRNDALIVARSLGRVNVRMLPAELMNWGALKGMRGPELPAEMRAGLLRRVWNRRADTADATARAVVSTSAVLDDMNRPWYRDGIALNYELSERFVGAKMLGPPSCWQVSGLGEKQIAVSKQRAALFIVE